MRLKIIVMASMVCGDEEGGVGRVKVGICPSHYLLPYILIYQPIYLLNGLCVGIYNTWCRRTISRIGHTIFKASLMSKMVNIPEVEKEEVWWNYRACSITVRIACIGFKSPHQTPTCDGYIAINIVFCWIIKMDIVISSLIVRAMQWVKGKVELLCVSLAHYCGNFILSEI